MSVGTMSKVFEYDMPEIKTDDWRTVPDSTAKFVLLALADHCNDEGEGAYPGVKRICKKTSMSSQTVCNALNALRTNGYTTLQDEPSRAGTNNYTINLEKLSQPLEFQPLESNDSSHKNQTILAARVKPSVNHQINHKEYPKVSKKVTDERLEMLRVSERIEAQIGITPDLKDHNWEKTVREIIRKEAGGQPFEKFSAWLRSGNDYNRPKPFQIAKNPKLILSNWAQAFMANIEGVAPVVRNDDGSLYV